MENNVLTAIRGLLELYNDKVKKAKEENRTVVYLCGKISDDVSYAKKFLKYKTYLENKENSLVLSPVQFGEELHYLLTESELKIDRNIKYEDYISICVSMLPLSDCILIVDPPTEEMSIGMQAEVMLARALKKKFLSTSI